ncbi:hypothetical protein Mpop_4286 [Methylorubrum populi BJ001]|jgi:hypothetical protein|uniref:DUF4747 family protein n=1 Tax=Methylorubrum populi (strain ATCC BAA-705 / NCIMB 13946 / BJ001) TaxID=441620 RepID=B1ZDZ9_METPB|nr:DUF4747 family protein [Methylorubrum populi]ACB82392.1 hypothetical protein Mpop_4286 [Methylorubrum populi BJ001]PZP70212.1 MAG: DUF4747 domain-containing protein [Methylorubrum populi]
MATLEFHALNISAHPHPAGIYRELFEKVAGYRFKYFGEKVAAISVPSSSSDGIFWGYIFSWTEIDANQRILDTLLMKEPDEEQKAKISIPDNIGFHWQIFHYAFRESDHTLIFESKNDENRTFAPANAERLFRALFHENVLRDLSFSSAKPDYVEVDLIVEASGIDRIFSIPNLRRLEILISVPNSDDNTKDADDLIEHLERVKANRQLTIYTAANPDEGIQPDDQIRAQTTAALRHGHTKGEGRDGENKVSISTKRYPQRKTAYVDSESTSVDTAINVARRWVSNFLGA